VILRGALALVVSAASPSASFLAAFLGVAFGLEGVESVAPLALPVRLEVGMLLAFRRRS